MWLWLPHSMAAQGLKSVPVTKEHRVTYTLLIETATGSEKCQRICDRVTNCQVVCDVQNVCYNTVPCALCKKTDSLPRLLVLDVLQSLVSFLCI